jgi:hypothetical protein
LVVDGPDSTAVTASVGVALSIREGRALGITARVGDASNISETDTGRNRWFNGNRSRGASSDALLKATHWNEIASSARQAALGMFNAATSGTILSNEISGTRTE